MLRLTLDIVPFGFEDRKRNLYTIEITNVGSSGVTHTPWGAPRYTYKARTIDEDGNKTYHGIVVKGFDRTKSAYELVDKVCKELEKKGVFGNV